MDAITKEALKILGGVVRHEAQVGLAHRKGPFKAKPTMDLWFSALAHLTSMADDYEKVKAERDTFAKGYRTLLTKITRYAPLVEAVEKAETDYVYQLSIKESVANSVKAILRAALKIKQEKEKP